MKKHTCLIVLLGVCLSLEGCSVPPEVSSSGEGSSSSSSSSVSSGSSAEEVTRTVRKKTITVYERKKDFFSLDAYYLDDIDAPYFKLNDIIDNRITAPGDKGFPIPNYSLSFNNNILTATQEYNSENYSISFDAINDCIYSDHYLDATDIFHYPLPMDITGNDPSVILKSTSKKRVSPAKRTEFNLKERNIDLYSYDSTVLIPLVVLNPIFFLVGEKDFAYNGKDLFLNSAIDVFGSLTTLAYSYSEEEKNKDRNKATTDFIANSLFCALDTFYGRFNEAVFTNFEDFSRYLGLYDNLHSPKPVTFFNALAEMVTKIDDIHSLIRASSPQAGNPWANVKDSYDKQANQTLLNSNSVWQGSRLNAFANGCTNAASIRLEAGIGSTDTFTYNGDTCFIRFDQFKRLANKYVFLADGKIADGNDTINSFSLFYHAFKDLKENHPEIKNIIIDESINGGGDATTMLELAGFFMDEVTLTIKNSITDEVFNYTYLVDTNYDGVYDEKDFQAKGYNVYCLISGCSFSCGNMFPSILQEYKSATIIGQTSAGGDCAVGLFSTAAGDLYNLSSPTVFGRQGEDGVFTSVDGGVYPSIHISPDYMYDESYVIDKIKG